MGLPYGVVTAAAQLGVDAILVKPKRAVGPFVAHATLRERHVDELDVVDHPVEAGSQISDHAFKRPPEVTIECAWSDSPPSRNVLQGLAQSVSGTVNGIASILTGNSPDQIKATYANLVKLQETKTLVDVYTGKRVYRNMILKSMIVETDAKHEHVLRVEATMRQVFIATVQVVTVGAPPDQQADPQATAPSIGKGIKQLTAAPKTFNLSKAVDALTPSASTLLFH